MNLTSEQKARVLVTEAVVFLARKHGVSQDVIGAAFMDGNEKIKRQLSDLIAAALVQMVRA